MRIVVSLFDPTQFFTLRLIEAGFDARRFFQTFQSRKGQFRLVFVGQRWEGNRRKTSRCEGVNGGCGNGDGFLAGDLRPVFQIVALSVLFSFEKETSQTSEICLANGFVHRCTTAKTFSLVMGGRRPPIRFRFDITSNPILDRNGQTRHFPRNVRSENVLDGKFSPAKCGGRVACGPNED